MADLGKFYNQWKDNLFQYCAIGPLLAFFLWLSLTTAVGLKTEFKTFSTQVGYDETRQQNIYATSNQGGTLENIFRFAFAIIIMVAGLKFSGEVAGAAGGQAAALGDYLTDKGRGIKESLIDRPAGATLAAGAAAGRGIAGAATLPARAFGQRLAGFAEGRLERFQQGQYTRFLTQKGQEEALKIERSRGLAAGSGRKEAPLHEKEHQAEEHGKFLEDTGHYEKPDDWQKLLGETTDWRAAMYASQKLADSGVMTDKDIKSIQEKTKKNLNDAERTHFLEALEKKYLDKTGRKLAISSINFDAETGTITQGGYGEIKQHVANASQDTLSKATGKDSFANAKVNDADTVAAEIDGLANNLQKIGKTDEKARERIAGQVDFMHALDENDEQAMDDLLVKGKIAGFKKHKAGDTVDGVKLQADESDDAFLRRIKFDKDGNTNKEFEDFKTKSKHALKTLRDRDVDLGSVRRELGAKFDGNGQKIGAGDSGGVWIQKMRVKPEKLQERLGKEGFASVENEADKFYSRQKIEKGGKGGGPDIKFLNSLANTIELQNYRAKLGGSDVNNEVMENALKEIENIRSFVEKNPGISGAEHDGIKARIKTVVDSLKQGEFGKHEEGATEEYKKRKEASASAEQAARAEEAKTAEILKEAERYERQAIKEEPLRAGLANLSSAVSHAADESIKQEAAEPITVIAASQLQIDTDTSKLNRVTGQLKSIEPSFTMAQSELKRITDQAKELGKAGLTKADRQYRELEADRIRASSRLENLKKEKAALEKSKANLIASIQKEQKRIEMEQKKLNT